MKFRCKQCQVADPCTLKVEAGAGKPTLCPYATDGSKPKWKRVRKCKKAKKP